MCTVRGFFPRPVLCRKASARRHRHPGSVLAEAGRGRPRLDPAGTTGCLGQDASPGFGRGVAAWPSWQPSCGRPGRARAKASPRPARSAQGRAGRTACHGAGKAGMARAACQRMPCQRGEPRPPVPPPAVPAGQAGRSAVLEAALVSSASAGTGLCPCPARCAGPFSSQ